VYFLLLTVFVVVSKINTVCYLEHVSWKIMLIAALKRSVAVSIVALALPTVMPFP
jgi:hypothetical protein